MNIRESAKLRNWRDYWSWQNLNPLNWSVREVEFFLGAFFAIMAPVFLFIGFQPIPVDATGYPTLQIPSINLETPVATVELVNRELVAPATIAGIYTPSPNKRFIIGHSSTVFKNLHEAQINDTFIYDDKTYQITKIETLAKSNIDMSVILKEEPINTVIIMTCAGESLPHQDATHRLIITAVLAEN